MAQIIVVRRNARDSLGHILGLRNGEATAQLGNRSRIVRLLPNGDVLTYRTRNRIAAWLPVEHYAQEQHDAAFGLVGTKPNRPEIAEAGNAARRLALAAA